MISVFHVQSPIWQYLSEYCLPFVKKGGLFVSYKSADSDAEIQEGKKAISILGGKLTSVDKFQLPDSDLRRALVCIKKVKDTPKKYPRKAGTACKVTTLNNKYMV